MEIVYFKSFKVHTATAYHWERCNTTIKNVGKTWIGYCSDLIDSSEFVMLSKRSWILDHFKDLCIFLIKVLWQMPSIYTFKGYWYDPCLFPLILQNWVLKSKFCRYFQRLCFLEVRLKSFKRSTPGARYLEVYIFCPVV